MLDYLLGLPSFCVVTGEMSQEKLRFLLVDVKHIFDDPLFWQSGVDGVTELGVLLITLLPEETVWGLGGVVTLEDVVVCFPSDTTLLFEISKDK